MKYLLYCILIIPSIVLSQNQTQISYDPSSNILSTLLPDCGLCASGTVDVARNCRCLENCETGLSDCRQDCIDNFSGLTNLSLCIQSCQENERNCNSICGPPLEPSKNIVSITYRYIIGWADIPNNPFNGPNIFTTSLITVATTVAEVPSINLPSPPWPEVFNTANTCYRVTGSVNYDDGTSCRFSAQECFLLG